EAVRAQERATADRDRARRQARRRRVLKFKTAVPTPPRRQPRFGRLPVRAKLGLALGWLLAQFVAWQLVSHPGPRLGIAIVSLFALPLVVVVLFNPARRYR
ncbi:MAG: hypothetical protein JWN57_2722, partial [Frankiales bacterium]|nr:hypothetical protein [Frankiales bacterium]